MSKQIRKTKILATLGPATASETLIQQLIDAGTDGFRLNFSHGDHDFFRPLFEIVRAAARRAGRAVAILQDLQGPKIRTGTLAGGEPVWLRPGKKFRITADPVPGNAEIVSTSYGALAMDLREGDRILIDDGAIELKVIETAGKEVITEIIQGGLLKEKKGINLPGIQISAESVTEKDIRDARFGIEMGVDFIALSFVRTGTDVARLRSLLTELQRPDVQLIAKIEKGEAVNNLNEILDISDGVMVARGDLGVELPPERVPLIQKMIIERANKAEKLVITATQMLESMVNNPRPTRAEASDVANAILDGTDVLMLSQETAVGQFPVETVRMMAAIACCTECDEDVFRSVEYIRSQRLQNFTHAVVRCARTAAEEMKAEAIIVFTETGLTAQLASSQRPQTLIAAFTPAEKTYQQLSLVWGVLPFFLESASDGEAMIAHAKQVLLDCGLVKSGDVVVLVTGAHPVRETTNMMKLEKC